MVELNQKELLKELEEMENDLRLYPIEEDLEEPKGNKNNKVLDSF